MFWGRVVLYCYSQDDFFATDDTDVTDFFALHQELRYINS